MNTIILDFVGIIADINKTKIISELTLKQKFSALRIFASRKKFPDITLMFEAYQKGLLDETEFQTQIARILPKSAYVVPHFLKGLRNNIKINPEVVKLVQEIRSANVQVVVMSNSTPETEEIIDDYNLDGFFDGIILSTEIGTVKPEPEIFNYAISEFNIDVENTLMIDDTEKNLRAARNVGISTIRCKNSKETCEVLNGYIKFLKNTHQL